MGQLSGVTVIGNRKLHGAGLLAQPAGAAR
jgi:hypothetical protein